MKLKKTTIIDIDLSKERKRLLKVYTKAEQKRLNRLYDLFEAGKFNEAIKYANTWGKTKAGYSEQEHITEEVFDVLWEIAAGKYTEKDFEIVPVSD